jgi:hypothetical protein
MRSQQPYLRLANNTALAGAEAAASSKQQAAAAAAAAEVSSSSSSSSKQQAAAAAATATPAQRPTNTTAITAATTITITTQQAWLQSVYLMRVRCAHACTHARVKSPTHPPHAMRRRRKRRSTWPLKLQPHFSTTPCHQSVPLQARPAPQRTGW